MATRKPAAKAAAKPVAKTRAAKKEAIISSNVTSFVNQATYEQRVREKAYELFLQRGGAAGHELNDWYEAEKIVSAGSNS